MFDNLHNYAMKVWVVFLLLFPAILVADTESGFSSSGSGSFLGKLGIEEKKYYSEECRALIILSLEDADSAIYRDVMVEARDKLMDIGLASINSIMEHDSLDMQKFPVFAFHVNVESQRKGGHEIHVILGFAHKCENRTRHAEGIADELMTVADFSNYQIVSDNVKGLVPCGTYIDSRC